MHATKTITPAQLPEVLLNVAVVRPVFLWGAPGVGKSSLVAAVRGVAGAERRERREKARAAGARPAARPRRRTSRAQASCARRN